MKVLGKHPKLWDWEIRVIDWIEAGFKKQKGRILVEPAYRSCFYNDWPDVVVISETYGVLIFEIKGHYNEEIRSIGNLDMLLKAGNQVLRYGRQLAEYGCLLRELLKGTGVPVRKFAVFPNILSTDPAANGISEFNNNHLDVMPIFNEALDWDFDPSRLELEMLDKKLSADELNKLYDILNPTRIVANEYYLDTQGLHADLKLLDDTQMEAIDSIKQGHYLLNGLPGSGKTVVLMKIAEREIAQGKDVLLTCYNKLLNDFLQRAIDAQASKTTSQFYADLMKRTGQKTINDKDFYEIYIKKLINENIEPFLDVLLVDEYQDLDDEEYTVMMKALRPNGLLVLSGDRLQNIRGKGQSWSSRGINIVGRSKFLRNPYRTAAAVVDFGIEFLSIKPSLNKEAMAYFKENKYEHLENFNYNLRDHVTFHLSKTSDFIEEVTNARDRNPEASILVIVHNPRVKKELSLLNDSKVMVETYGRVKGIEADIVFIYNVDGYLDNQNLHEKMTLEQKMRSVFSALCRARSHVHIHGFKDTGLYLDLRESFNRYVKRKISQA